MNLHRFYTIDGLDFSAMLAESLSEGHQFVERFLSQYATGANRFDQPGEALFLILDGKAVIGMGGLNRDPYLDRNDVGRVRHVYVLHDFRGRGYAKALLHAVMEEARKSFRLLTLFTSNPRADSLYRAFGFRRVDHLRKASHVMTLSGYAEQFEKDGGAS